MADLMDLMRKEVVPGCLERGCGGRAGNSNSLNIYWHNKTDHGFLLFLKEIPVIVPEANALQKSPFPRERESMRSMTGVVMVYASGQRLQLQQFWLS